MRLGEGSIELQKVSKSKRDYFVHNYYTFVQFCDKSSYDHRPQSYITFTNQNSRIQNKIQNSIRQIHGSDYQQRDARFEHI